MADVEIKIFGGSNQVMPNATQGVQNFYGDQFAEQALRKEDAEGIDALNDDESMLFVYLQSVQKVHRYVAMLTKCKDTCEVAGVVMLMLNEKGISKELVVKAEFIEKLFPFVMFKKGANVAALRAQINALLIGRKR